MTHPTTRLLKIFSAKKKALIPFLTAGYPHPDATLPLMNALVEAGADVIELGMPFSDPMADGPVIEAAGHVALSQGINVAKAIEMVKIFRRSNSETPVILMGYANPIESFGLEHFAQCAQDAGLDGVLLVDVPPEESLEWKKILNNHGLSLIYLIAPTTPDARIAHIAQQAEGYLYTVSLKGVTGSSALDTRTVKAQVARIRKYTSIPIGVGFGVRSVEHVRAIGEYADGIIIGSRLIEIIGEAWQGQPTYDQALITTTQAVKDFIAELKCGFY